MPPKTYGSKRSTAAPGAAAIFGTAPVAPPSPLGDLTSAVNDLSLQEEDYSLESASIIKPYASLLPLCNAYKTDLGQSLLVQDWNDILDDDADLTKIAEASYAEVYRVNTSAGSSILKVMRIEVPELPESLRSQTSIDVNSLISEIRIMNALATVPNFVTFKDAHLVQGMIPRCLKEAYSKHKEVLKNAQKESWFPNPHLYSEETMFLVIELGDAGEVLDEFKLDTVEKVWDVFIGTTIALARAEVTNKFEHRDLHENNICIKYDPKKSSTAERTQDSPLKYGFTGLEITIIDYGLSRALLANGEIAFNDLEQDLEVFKGQATGIPGQQYDTYRRMRTYLIEGTRTMRLGPWHISDRFLFADPPVSWSNYIPYTNVLWLRYLLYMLAEKFRNDSPTPKAYNNFAQELKELKRRLGTRTKVENGAFSNAQEVLLWMSEQGWVNEEQIAGDNGTSFLSEG